MMRRIVSAVALLVLHVSSTHAQTVTAVTNLDLNQYIGKWFEIARLPNKFQKQCVSDVVATYVKRTDGDIDVINSCKNAAGVVEEALGRARAPQSPNMGKLKVRFAPQWLSWLPMVWADYWVVDLASDYSVAAVGDPTRKYLWILSRNQSIPDAMYQPLMKRLGAQGYDTSLLVLTNQNALKQSPAPR
ncbi:MAG: apolipoprotein D and lipocalin family protein [Burkholderiaceae bacterium]|jgi:apolipoprotein D and lipocalin family protein